MSGPWISFSAFAVCFVLVSLTGSVATITHHWSSLRIPEERTTPLTTATGGYNITGSYHAGLFQFCMDEPSAGHVKTCYGITMPMDYACAGPEEDVVRSGNSLYFRLTLIRVCMIVGVLISFAAAIVCGISVFKKRKQLYHWCALALAVLQFVAFAAACALYGHTEAYWYKCGHNQCGGVSRCLFSFGYSYGLAGACALASFVCVFCLWGLRRSLPEGGKSKESLYEPLKKIVSDALPKAGTTPRGQSGVLGDKGGAVQRKEKLAEEAKAPISSLKTTPATRTAQGLGGTAHKASPRVSPLHKPLQPVNRKSPVAKESESSSDDEN